MTNISNTDNIIAVSDITARVDELRGEREQHDKENGTIRNDGDQSLTEDGIYTPGSWDAERPDDSEELTQLEILLVQLRGIGCNHQWDDDGYPDSIIADSYFEDYARNLAHDLGAVDKNASWVVVNWEATANGVKMGYKAVDFDGSTYWARN